MEHSRLHINDEGGTASVADTEHERTLMLHAP